MITVQPNKRNYLQDTQKELTKPVPVIVEIIYKFMHIVAGFDFGFFGHLSNKQQYLLKMLTVTFILIAYPVGWISVYRISVPTATLYGFYTVQYFTCVAIFVVSKNQFYNFLLSMESIDSDLNSKTTPLGKILIGIVLLIFARTNMTFYWCIFVDFERCLKPRWVLILLYLIIYCHDFLLLSNTLVYYLIYGRLGTLANRLEKCVSMEEVIKYNNIYKSIVDATDIIKKSFDPQLFMALLLNVPENMAYIYVLVFLLRHDLISFNAAGIYFASLSVSGTIVLTVLPALFAGSMASQTDTIRVILTNKLLLEQDDKKSRSIEKFINYVETRPLKFYVYKVIPLNADLLGMVVNFLITYLVVIIQLTHLY